MAKHLRPQIYVAIVAIVAMATVMSFSSRARTAFSSSARPSGAVAVSRTPSVRAYASSAQQFVDNGIKDNKVKNTTHRMITSKQPHACDMQ